MTRHTTVAGTFATPRRSKNPIRVAAGKLSVQKRDPKGLIRSTHLGYDCYQTGNINGGGRTRVIMRATRLPPHLPRDMVAIMPRELWWPQRDHHACHAMIDAIITCDLGALASWKSSWPDHVFGFEQFMGECERRMTGLQDASKQDHPNKRADGNGNRGAVTLMFPGTPVSIDPHGSKEESGYCVRTHIVRFNDGLAALRVDVLGIVEAPDSIERVPCSRAYVDLVTGKYEIVQHYPGHLKALGLSPDLIYQVLGVRAPGSSNHRQHIVRPLHPRSRARQEMEESPRQHSRRIAEDGRQIQTVVSSGDPDARVVKERTQEGDPIPMAGNPRYERELTEQEEAPEFEQFPDAPGHHTGAGHR